MQIITFPWSRFKETFQLAEVISEETALRQENRKMSVIIAEAQTVIHLIITIFIIFIIIAHHCYHSSDSYQLVSNVIFILALNPFVLKQSFTFSFNKEVKLQHEWSTGWPSETDETNICQVKLQIKRTRPVWYVSNMKSADKKMLRHVLPFSSKLPTFG